MKQAITKREHQVWQLAYELTYQTFALHNDVHEKAIANATAAVEAYHSLQQRATIMPGSLWFHKEYGTVVVEWVSETLVATRKGEYTLQVFEACHAWVAEKKTAS
jgi:hypothetical protein